MTNPLERVVHAYAGPEKDPIVEVVRYDKAGKWYIEWGQALMPCQKVSVTQAAQFAVALEDDGGTIFPRQYGGTVFIRQVEAFREARDTTWLLEHNPKGVLLGRVHPERNCAGQHCTIHNRSDHHMRDMPQHWRSDRGIMERICPHGIGHPDPDEINPDTVHGCDGCCVVLEGVPS